MNDIEFHFDEIGNGSGATNLSVPALLAFIAAMHTQLADTGAWEHLETTTHNELMALAAQAEVTSTELETPRMLVLSTAHITHRTSLILDGKRPGPRPLLFPKGEYGWIIPIIDPLGADADEDARWSLPEILAIRKLADASGCTWIMLDRDADTVDGLPVYDW